MVFICDILWNKELVLSFVYLFYICMLLIFRWKDKNVLIVWIFYVCVLGIILFEYFCDMGYNVSMMVDLILWWVEVFCEIFGWLVEMFVGMYGLLFLVRNIFNVVWS